MSFAYDDFGGAERFDPDDLDVEELRRAALAVVPGHWTAGQGEDLAVYSSLGPVLQVMSSPDHSSFDQSVRDYVARLNPEAILKLLDMLDDQREGS